MTEPLAAADYEHPRVPRVGRNIVVCLDGTNNEFRVDGNTNVVRLREVVSCDPSTQLVYYDPGVGTLPEPGLLTRMGQRLSRYWSLAFGTGLIRNVEEAYTYLMNYWEPGDRVFLFGFSRGAYCARVLAGLLHSLGLLPRGSENLVPYVSRIFGAARTSRDYWRLCHKFRRTFARPVEGSRLRRFPIHFIGLWDTVSSVGWVWDPQTYPYTAKNPSITHIRHAVAIDERRAFFRQNLFQRAGRQQDLQEHWFAGVHADIGGGYAEAEGNLWISSFDWLVSEARQTGLLIDDRRLKELLDAAAERAPAWAAPKHESLTWKWWPAELIPKTRRTPAGARSCRCNLGRHRELREGALIDLSALLRLRHGPARYQPPNLCPQFVSQVRALPEIPLGIKAMPYHCRDAAEPGDPPMA